MTEAPEPEEARARGDKTVVRKSVSGMLWSYVSFFATKMLSLISLLILARFLSPADFGVMALTIAVIGYFEIVSRIGLGSALISAREQVAETANAVFFFSMLLSGLMALALWLSSEGIAGFMNEPQLVDVLNVIAVTVIISGLPTVSDSLLQKELQFKRKLVPEVMRGLVKGLLSIALALLGFGVWSLVYGYLAGTAVFAVVSIAMRPWRPTGLPRLDVTKRAFLFGINMFTAQLINMIPQTLDNILVGKILGTSSLGIYALAYRIPELCLKTFTAVAMRVVHPIMAEIQTEPEQLRRYYYGYMRYFALMTLPCGAVLATLSDPLVRVLYSPDWYGMITPMMYLSIAFAIWTLRLLPGSIYKAINRTDLMLRVSIYNLPIFVLGLWLSVPYGIDMVSRAQVAIAIASMFPGYAILRSVIGVTLPETFEALLPGVTCAVAVATASIAAQMGVHGGALIELLAGLAAAGLAYLVSARLMAPEVYKELLRMRPKRLARKRA